MEHFNEFLNVVKAWHQNEGRKHFFAKSLEDWLTNNGYEVLDTHGLPFNGTTYEVRRTLPNIPNAYQVCGHFKCVSAIYGHWVGLFFYPPACEGAEHLNGDELDKWEYKIDTRG